MMCVVLGLPAPGVVYRRYGSKGGAYYLSFSKTAHAYVFRNRK